jgi:Dynamin family
MHGPASTEPLNLFREQRSEVARLARRAASAVRRLDEPGLSRDLERLADPDQDSTFRVVVVGEFKKGKSTLVNALIGQQLLPVSLRPMTAVTTVVRYAPEPRALAFPRGPGAPKEIPLAELAAYVGTSADGPDESARLRYVQVTAPLPSLAGLELVDTPGLGEQPLSERDSFEQTAGADAVIVVLSPLSLSPVTVRQLVSETALASPGRTFFVFNRMDQLRGEDRGTLPAQLTGRLNDALEGYFQAGEDRVFFVSARDAVRSLAVQDSEALTASGVPLLESRLYAYLGNDVGRERIYIAAQRLRQLCDTSLDLIDRRERNYRSLDHKAGASPEKLDELGYRRDAISRWLFDQLTLLLDLIYAEATRAIKEVAENIRSYAREVEIGEPVMLGSSNSAKAESIARKLRLLIQDRVRGQLASWQEDIFRPMLDERAHQIDATLQSMTREFLDSADLAKPRYTSGRRLTASSSLVPSLADALLQLEAELSSHYEQEPGGEGSSGSSSEDERPSAARATALGSLAALPLAGALSLAAVGAAGVLAARSATFQARTRTYLGDQAAELLHSSADSVAGEFTNRFRGPFSAFTYSVDGGLKLVIDDMRHELERRRYEASWDDLAASSEMKAELEAVSHACLELISPAT